MYISCMFHFKFEFFWLPEASTVSFFSTCPLNLQPCWNHSPLTLVLKKKKKVQRALSRNSGRVSFQTLLRGKQPSVHASSPLLTRRKCSKFNLESYGFECGTAWVSEFLSFDFTQYETRGLNLPGRATEHPGVRLNSLCCELAVVHTVRAGDCLVKCHCCNLTHCISSAVFFYLRKMGTNQLSQLLLWVKGLFCHCCWSTTVIQDHLGGSGRSNVLEALGKTWLQVLVDKQAGVCQRQRALPW